jgi:hypothetical protein
MIGKVIFPSRRIVTTVLRLGAPGKDTRTESPSCSTKVSDTMGGAVWFVTMSENWAAGISGVVWHPVTPVIIANNITAVQAELTNRSRRRPGSVSKVTRRIRLLIIGPSHYLILFGDSHALI